MEYFGKAIVCGKCSLRLAADFYHIRIVIFYTKAKNAIAIFSFAKPYWVWFFR
jgi:hypothetical protein